MAVSFGPSLSPLFVLYVGVFAVTAVVCFASVWATTRIEDPDTRRGLAALLLLSGGWASSHVGFLLAPTPTVAVGFYTAGLVVGMATVGPWLYFCSAYTGRSLHRDRTLQYVAVGVYLAIVLVKVTNPVHDLYFTVAFATQPFPHLSVTHGTAHWLAMALAYSLSMVGYFMLFERLTQVSYDTRPLFVLVGVTGLPVVLDVLGFTTPYLVDMTYEPLGVAVFAVGVLFLYLNQLRAVRVAGSRDEPAILLDDEDTIREYNEGAEGLFPQLAEQRPLGEPLWSVLPELAEALAEDASVIELQHDDESEYYRVTENAFAADQAPIGRLVVLDDVTERERYRRELERQNERLERFASMVSHDLRNPLNVALARIEIAREERDDENLATAADALDRMEALIADVLSLARQGQPIDGLESVSLAALAESSWSMVDAPSATLSIAGDRQLAADPDRLKRLFENLFRNAIEHNDEDVTVTVGPLDDGFFLADDGQGIPREERDQVFESGYTTDRHGTGFGLAIVAEVVAAHDWTVEVTESEAGGARFEVRGVDPA